MHDSSAPTSTSDLLEGIGSRLKALRQAREATLGEISYATGISISTLSRLESGKRRPNLELLVPIARALNVPLDDIVGRAVDDPRIPNVARQIGTMTVVPLTREPGNHQTYKMIIPPSDAVPDTRVHEGTEWLYVLSGQLRLILGSHDIVMGSGEAAEFNTRVPHWMGCVGTEPVELLSIFGRDGERVHLRTPVADGDTT
jgi:transcriptional regulator with XRE-family HTH domain